ncbi:DNA-3-methyladenine glycosylase I [Liquorilactobacillus satsumensis]|uniref:DNA-3-methyladenine glycosylase I n=1 Tax=Liquorilactobacillus satsumensis TaxID=259059 RepID=UPI0021C2E2C2|nr:DNA-3-methyladenine glycosylase I [Liquorilactobacillus satsumensis]MCP9312359.1 DNA-3-methyladenine glycosylase I [Liquorilactobacillus satsumensis]MCP9359637.1 DNA-3-methyladenine glycosylase I [Liquorilactobacillus satsumensis]
MVHRCSWAVSDDLLLQYHDEEWGKIHVAERESFELLSLGIMQAGLRWEVVLKKRIALKKAFKNFYIELLTQLTEAEISSLLLNPNIIRNRRKIDAVLKNAQLLSELHRRTFRLSQYLWHFTEGRPIINHWQFGNQLPEKTILSTKIAFELKKMGFNFVGPTLVYALMQSLGIVNDHLESCFYKYHKVINVSSEGRAQED